MVIREYGIEWKTVREDRDMKALWLVHGGKWWEQDAGARAVCELKDCRELAVIYNRVISGMRLDVPEGVNRSRCFQAPDFGDPWKLDGEVRTFFRELTKMDGLFQGQAEAGEKSGKRRSRLWKKYFKKSH